jgi:type IV secretory pathway VirB2 component (pilin)
MMQLASVIQSSLFEPAGTSPLRDSLGWIQELLFGSIAIGLCVLAVAFVGLLALTGRLPLRRGAQVILGSFVLLGAPVIAAGLMTGTQNVTDTPREIPIPEPAEAPRQDLPPADYDPYSGASLRRN